MIDGLLVLLQFSVFCAFCWVMARRYTVSVKQEVEAEKTRKDLLHAHRDDLQKELAEAHHAAQEQEMVSRVLINKVDQWRVNFLQQQEDEQKRLAHFAQLVSERNERISRMREAYILQKELLPQALEKAYSDLVHLYEPLKTKQAYNQSVINHLMNPDSGAK